MPEGMSEEELREVEAWASEFPELWLLVPRRGAVARLREVSAYTELQRLTDTVFDLVADVRRLREALAFARSVIKSGEPWTARCEEMIDGALAPRAAAPPREED